MSYQGRTDEWLISVGWNWVINATLVMCPSLFGCRLVVLEKIVTERERQNLLAAFEKLGAVKVAEARQVGGKADHYYFRVQKQPIALIVEDQQPMKILAPEPLIEYVQNELKIVLS